MATTVATLPFSGMVHTTQAATRFRGMLRRSRSLRLTLENHTDNPDSSISSHQQGNEYNCLGAVSLFPPFSIMLPTTLLEK